MPSAHDGELGFDHLEGWTDAQNWASCRILEKCGFILCETLPDPENALRRNSELAIFRKARPGKTLEKLGLLASTDPASEAEAPMPPVQ